MALKAPRFWRSRSLISWLLYPFSLLYADLVRLRHVGAAPVVVNATVWCVGNVVLGGAGKTPTALALGRYAKAQCIKACFLSRGYGGTLRGPVQVNPAEHSAAEVGDEPLLLAGTLPTFVARDRAAGAQQADSQGYELIILDDGFQNPHLHKDFSLLVVDETYGFGNGWCLPAGPLREPVRRGLQRADAVVQVSRTIGQSAPPSIPTYRPIIRARLESRFSEKIDGRPLVAFSGIAHPQAFFDGLKAADADLRQCHAYGDHHTFTANDWHMLTQSAKHENARLITTAKDAARLTENQKSDLLIADLHLVWQNEGELAKLLPIKRKV